MNRVSVDAATRAAKKGVTLVRSSRVAVGKVGRNVELDDDPLGFVASDEVHPQKSRVLRQDAFLLEPPLTAVVSDQDHG